MGDRRRQGCDPIPQLEQAPAPRLRHALFCSHVLEIFSSPLVQRNLPPKGCNDAIILKRYDVDMGLLILLFQEQGNMKTIVVVMHAGKSFYAGGCLPLRTFMLESVSQN
jgi:hypothetical protein